MNRIDSLNEINEIEWYKHLSSIEEYELYEINYIPLTDFPLSENMETTLFPIQPNQYDNIRQIFQKIYPNRWLANRSFVSKEY